MIAIAAKSFVVIVGVTLIFFLVLYARSQKPARKQVVTVDRFELTDQIIGDGAWIITAAEFPPSGVLRRPEPEPRGM